MSRSPLARGGGFGCHQQDDTAAGLLGGAHHGQRGGEVVAGERRHGGTLLQGGGDQVVQSGTHQTPRPPTRIQATKVSAKPARPRMVVRTVHVFSPSETVRP